MTLPLATLKSFRHGDPAAFAEVVRAYSALVEAAASRFWRNAFEREEAMQEIWAQAYRNREALSPERLGSFSGWLAVLARRKCIDLMRQSAAPLIEGEDEEAAALRWLQAPPAQESFAEESELLQAAAPTTRQSPRAAPPGAGALPPTSRPWPRTATGRCTWPGRRTAAAPRSTSSSLGRNRASVEEIEAGWIEAAEVHAKDVKIGRRSKGDDDHHDRGKGHGRGHDKHHHHG